MHRPTWAVCTEIRVSKSSEIGSFLSFNPTWKLRIRICATIISPKLSCCGHLRPLIPRLLLHPRRRKARSLLLRVALLGSLTPTEAHNRGSMYHNKDRGEWVGASKIISRSISLEATNGDDDPVREVEEAEIQVSDDLLHRGVIKRFITPCGYPPRFSRCADGTWSPQLRTGSDRSKSAGKRQKY